MEAWPPEHFHNAHAKRQFSGLVARARGRRGDTGAWKENEVVVIVGEKPKHSRNALQGVEGLWKKERGEEWTVVMGARNMPRLVHVEREGRTELRWGVLE